MFAQALQQILSRQAGLRHQHPDLIAAERIRQIVRADRVVLAGADPGVGDFALTVLLKLIEQVAKAAAQHAAGRAARKQSAEAAFHQVAKSSAKSATKSAATRTAATSAAAEQASEETT